MVARGKQFKGLTQHTIDNNEIGLALCGKLLPYKGASDPTPWDMGSGHVATWDDDNFLPGHDRCPGCRDGYDARVADIDKRNAEANERYSRGVYH